MENTCILFQLALNAERHVNREHSGPVSPSTPFSKVVLVALTDPYDDLAAAHLQLKDIEVFVNRSPATPFFPIAANEKQIKAFRQSLKSPPHVAIPEGDLELPVSEVCVKYHCTAFTLYLKRRR